MQSNNHLVVRLGSNIGFIDVDVGARHIATGQVQHTPRELDSSSRSNRQHDLFPFPITIINPDIAEKLGTRTDQVLLERHQVR